MKKTLFQFLISFLIVLFLGSCTITENRYYSYYDFGGSGRYTHILLDEAEIAISLFETNSVLEYRFSLSLGSIEQPLSQFENIVLNNIKIYAGDKEFNMVDRIINISSYIENNPRSDFWRFNEDEIKNVHSTGIIGIEILKRKFNFPVDAKTNFILFEFSPIPIDCTKYRQITISFDITFEHLTGEKTRWDQVFEGNFVLKNTKIRRPFLTA